LRQTDILLMGDEDARALLGEGDDRALLMRGAALGPQVVVLKCAERGALALADGHIAAFFQNVGSRASALICSSSTRCGEESR
jgi:sugar/nucleoside kinase (ribokinase family)